MYDNLHEACINNSFIRS